MSYTCGTADWIDLAIGRLEDAKRSLRECDRLRQGCDICEELRQARRCLNTMYDGMFIVGIDTPAGPATYHYDVEPYWDMFPCEVLDRAPEWDGHTPDDAIERIGTLRDVLQAEVKEEGSEK